MSNKAETVIMRNYWRRVLIENAKRRLELEERWQKDVHSVDSHAFRDVSRSDDYAAKQLVALGGSLRNLDAED
jgi:hypothetical protein